MRILKFLSAASLLVVGAAAASSWTFDDAIISVQSKGASVGGFKDKLSDHVPLTKPITLGAADKLKILLTSKEGKTAKRPHQGFLLLRDMDAGLEISMPFDFKDTGKGKVEITQRDLPTQLLSSAEPLQATIILGSFGPSTAFSNHVFNLNVVLEPAAPVAGVEKPLRYGKLNEIHHIFRPDAKSPPKVVTLVFLAAVLACLPVLFVVWGSLGANLNHLPKALADSPVSHTLFFGSILALEGIFFLYYTRWNLFQTIPAVTAVGMVSFLSGSRALSEVQERRLAGLR